MKKNSFIAPIVIFGLISVFFLISLIVASNLPDGSSYASFSTVMMVFSIMLCALFIVFRVRYLKNNADEIKAENDEYKAEKAYLAQFRPTRSANGVGIDEVHKLVSILGFTKKIYRYSDIAGYNILRREQSSTKGHSVGRAVVGGAVAGVVGAAVGAASGLETKTSTMLAVDISFSDGKNQIIYFLNSDKPVSNTAFINAERNLEKVTSMLDTVIAENSMK